MTIPMTDHADRPPLSDVAYDLVRDAILSGHCAPGEVVRAEDIARAVGCSATPVNTAVDRLLRGGLLERNGKIRVTSPDAETGRDAAATLRWFIDGLVVTPARADAAYLAIRVLGHGNHADLQGVRQVLLDLCDESSNRVLAEVLRQHLDGLLLKARRAARGLVAVSA